MEEGLGAQQVAPHEVNVSAEKGKLPLWADPGTAAWWLTHLESRECVNITEKLGWTYSKVELDYKLSGNGVVSIHIVDSPSGYKSENTLDLL